MYRLGESTVHRIVREVTKVLWAELSAEFMPIPGEDGWRQISENFYRRWNLPNCCAAVDGKHVAIQCPRNGGSLYYNYKKFHSINLMAMCDSDYKFVAVDVGAYGGNSDGSVFANSSFGHLLLTNQLSLPASVPLPNSDIIVPYYIVGDAAFPLKENLMRPYPGKQLPPVKEHFNYRLSRARRTIENAFGILVARWRILKSSLIMEPEAAEYVVLACVILHNFVKTTCPSYCPPTFVDHENTNGVVIEGEWRATVSPLPGINASRISAGNNARQSAYRVRDKIAGYLLRNPL